MHMNFYRGLVFSLWILFTGYWAIAARWTKPNVHAHSWRKGLGLRLGLAVVLVSVLSIPSVMRYMNHLQTLVDRHAEIAAAGTVICVLGMAFAFWARLHIGRNWGVPMSQKENPELVTTGPYAFIRHPIYTGVLTALLGTGLSVSVICLPCLIAGTLYFIYSARREEAFMSARFPEAYPAYMQRTKMLIPFLY